MFKFRRRLVSVFLAATCLLQAGAWAEPAQRFILDGANPCARSLQASQGLGLPLYYEPGPMPEETIELELNRKFPPFSWRQTERPQWLIEGHRETLADLDLLLSEVIDGTAHRELNLPVSLRIWLGTVFGPLGDFRQRKAQVLRWKVRRLNAQTVTDEEMLRLFEDLYQVISARRFPLRALTGYPIELRKSGRDIVPNFHLFFTLREIDYLDVIGLRAAGVFPVGMLTTQKGWWDGFNGEGWLFPSHDISHTSRQIESLANFFIKNSVPPLTALQFEYDALRRLAKNALSRPTPLERFAGVGAIFEMVHESNQSVFDKNYELDWFLSYTEEVFVRYRQQYALKENPRLFFPEGYKPSMQWQLAKTIARERDQLLRSRQ